MLDAPDADPELLRGEMRNLRRVNVQLGSLKLVRRAVLALASGVDADRTIEIVDLATGSADHPVALVEAFRSLDRRVVVTAIDQHPVMIEEARTFAGHLPEIRIEQGNILALPYADRQFDIATCSYTLHHLSAAEVVTLLREMNRLTRVGFVVHDLARSSGGIVAAWAYTHLLSTNVMTRHDGYVSVMNAFTAPELRDLAAQAGVANLTVSTDARFRLVAVKRHDRLAATAK